MVMVVVVMVVMVVAMMVFLVLVVVMAISTGNRGELIFGQLFQGYILSLRRLLKNGEHGSLLSKLRVLQATIEL
jgi:hypothetical protein